MRRRALERPPLEQCPLTTRNVPERPEHHDAVERVLDRAFGPGRFAKSSERLRERGAEFEPDLSRIALNEHGEVLGCCRIWRVRAGKTLLYFLGPLAVDPDAQGSGLGLALVKDAVAAVRAAGGVGIVVVGAASFFGPLGFTTIPAGRLMLPSPVDQARLLWMPLSAGALDRAAGPLQAPR